MKLAVTTLGCPNWSLDEILTNVKGYGYDGIELRGLGADLDISQSPYFATPSALAQTKLDFANAGLEICGIDSSAQFTDADSSERSLNMAHARKMIDLAATLDAPCVRVFGGAIPEGEERGIAEGRVVECLHELGEYCVSNGGDVSVVLETHDAFSTGLQVRTILTQVNHPRVAALWDLHHPYRHGETPQESYDYLKPFTRLTHVKDSLANENYCLLGEGDIPIRPMIALLRAGGYQGYLSVEWEKRWIPALADPDIAFPQYAAKLREYLAEVA